MKKESPKGKMRMYFHLTRI